MTPFTLDISKNGVEMARENTRIKSTEQQTFRNSPEYMRYHVSLLWQQHEYYCTLMTKLAA